MDEPSTTTAAAAAATAPPQREGSSVAALMYGELRLGELDLLSSRDWRPVALQGLFALMYGVLALCFPVITLAIFTYLFASFAVLSGVICVYYGVSARGRDSSWWIDIVEGLLCIGAGLWGLVWPGMTAVFMLYIVAAWAILTGASEVLIGCNTRERIQWGHVVNGLGLVLLGGFLYGASPADGILALIWAVGVQGVVAGLFLLFTAVWLQRQQSVHSVPSSSDGEGGGEERRADETTYIQPDSGNANQGYDAV